MIYHLSHPGQRMSRRSCPGGFRGHSFFKGKNYTIEETSTESETEIESGSDENVPLKPLSDIAPNKH